jgi:acyl-CoA synthetase (AMP-forming)/AMP-acid ligase II
MTASNEAQAAEEREPGANFHPPPFDPPVPFPDYLVRVALENLDREAILIIKTSERGEVERLQSITWTHILNDVLNQVDALTSSTCLPARKLGDPPVVVGLLARNGYDYFVTMSALTLLRWTVSAIMSMT